MLRQAGSKSVVDHFIWPGDVSDPHAPKQTKAHWAPDGLHVAITIRSGRSSRHTSVYRVSDKGLLLIRPSPVSAGVMQRLGPADTPSNGGTVFQRWLDERTVEMLDETYGANRRWRISSDGQLELVGIESEHAP